MSDAVISAESNYDDSGEREAILQSLYHGLISLAVSAEMLASVSLKPDDIEEAIFHTWEVLVHDALQSTSHHHTLSELIVAIANLPPAKDNQGQQRTIESLRIWDDLPLFGWAMYDEFKPLGSEDGEQTIELSINVNKFTPQLLHADRMFASYDWWALVLMREALEYPVGTPDRPKSEALIPAALEWSSILGPDIYTWDKEFPSSDAQGDPGKGGPLWNGQQRFCEGLWEFVEATIW